MNPGGRKDSHYFGRLPFTEDDQKLHPGKECKDAKMNESSKSTEEKSAPMEVLTEFLSLVMTKDYRNALKYCELILKYEPDNKTVQEFHPMILEKIKAQEELDIDARHTETSSTEESQDSTNTLGDENGAEDEATSHDETDDSQLSSGSSTDSRRSSDSSEDSDSCSVPQHIS
ncbi:unnamed protein product [Hermetia illucens]|uniref:Glutamate-rich protein 2 n=2 Tax=Hermetia illucens TaxID=343691 RepID=A0A7R8YNZ7_HERIL|nr:unnamed protein product [Hermetia illucens]